MKWENFSKTGFLKTLFTGLFLAQSTALQARDQEAVDLMLRNPETTTSLIEVVKNAGGAKQEQCLKHFSMKELQQQALLRWLLNFSAADMLCRLSISMDTTTISISNFTRQKGFLN